MNTRILVRTLGLLLLPLLAGTAGAQQVPAEEQERLRREIEALKAQLAASQSELEKYLDLLDAQLGSTRDSLRAVQAGTTRFVVTGYGVGGYNATRDGPGSFNSEFVPILLWQLNDRVLFAAEPEFEMGEELEIGLEYAQLSSLVTDFLTLGAGKFITPFSLFNPRLHAAWINKLPDAPLAFGHGGLAPGSGVGLFARGGVALGLARASYAVYAINAPELMTEGEEAGLVEPVDASEERAYGGRVGLFLLRSGLEVGYSFQTSESATLHGGDLSFVRLLEPLGGALDLRVEALRSTADAGPFTDAAEPGEERWLVDNRRSGGYGQLAFRPLLAPGRFVRDLEPAVRVEWLDAPNWRDGPKGNDATRFTAGLGYYVTPSARVKAAFQRTNNTVLENEDSFLFQATIGF